MIGESTEDIKNGSLKTVIRDGIISFGITWFAVLIDAGFPRDPLLWLESIYVPTLTAGMTFFISLAVHYKIRRSK